MSFYLGVTACTGDRDSVFRPGGGAGRPAPWEALVVRPRPRRGPLGWGAGRLWRGEARHGAGGDRPGEGQQHQEEHAGPTAPQKHWFLSKSGEELTTREEQKSNSESLKGRGWQEISLNTGNTLIRKVSLVICFKDFQVDKETSWALWLRGLNENVLCCLIRYSRWRYVFTVWGEKHILFSNQAFTD